MSVMRNVLLSISRQPRIKDLILAVPLTRAVVARFVPGEGLDDLVVAVRELREKGIHVSIDYLGEDTRDRAMADAMRQHYLDVIARLEAEGLADMAEVSLKLSAMGQFLEGEDGHALALGNAREVCRAARNAGMTVTLDMEDHTTTDSTLGVLAELRQDFPDVGCVLQAYLHRTLDDVAAQAAIPGARVRLCKGAYQEPPELAHQHKADVDAAYVRCLRVLMEGQGYPMVASHDPRMIQIAAELAQRNGRGADGFEFQLLYGIRTAEQERLAALGHQVRVYVPVGTDWYGYFTRRLAERPANLLFFLRSFLGNK